jgi:hypothetical protein
MSLQDLIGPDKRQEYDDFIRRYDKGDPWDGISDDEAASRYDEVAGRLSESEYRESAQEALGRLSPQQRRQLGQQLRGQAKTRKLGAGELEDADDDRLEDTNFLANALGGLQGRQPGLLGQLLGGGGGGGGGGLLSSPIAKGALSGIAAMAAKRFMSR